VSAPTTYSAPWEQIPPRTTYMARALEYLRFARKARISEARARWYVQPDALYWAAMNDVAKNRAAALACVKVTL
jgi:hypothetical protein